MSISVKVGDIVPLVAQLECPIVGNTYYVRAIIEDPTTLVLQTVDLVDSGEGLFKNNTYVMPDKTYITAQYKVYSDPGYTMESSDFCFNVDVFTKEETTAGTTASPDIEVTLDQTDELVVDLELGEVDVILEESSEIDVVLDQDQDLLVDFQSANLEIELEVC